MLESWLRFSGRALRPNKTLRSMHVLALLLCLCASSWGACQISTASRCCFVGTCNDGVIYQDYCVVNYLEFNHCIVQCEVGSLPTNHRIISIIGCDTQAETDSVVCEQTCQSPNFCQNGQCVEPALDSAQCVNQPPLKVEEFDGCAKISESEAVSVYANCELAYLWNSTTQSCDSVLTNKCDYTYSYPGLGDYTCSQMSCYSYDENELRDMQYDVASKQYVAWYRTCTYSVCEYQGTTQNDPKVSCTPWTHRTFDDPYPDNTGVPSDSSALDSTSSNYGNNVHCSGVYNDVATMYSDNGDLWGCPATSCSEAMLSYKSGGSCYRDVNPGHDINPGEGYSSSSVSPGSSASPGSSDSPGSSGSGEGSSGSGDVVVDLSPVVDTLHAIHYDQDDYHGTMTHWIGDISFKFGETLRKLDNVTAATSGVSGTVRQESQAMRDAWQTLMSMQNSVITSAASAAADTTSGAIQSASTSVTNAVNSAASTVSTSISDVGTSINASIASASSSVSNTVQQVGNSITQSLVDVMAPISVLDQAFVDSVKSMHQYDIEWNNDVFVPFTNDVLDAIKDSLPAKLDFSTDTLEAKADTVAAKLDSTIKKLSYNGNGMTPFAQGFMEHSAFTDSVYGFDSSGAELDVLDSLPGTVDQATLESLLVDYDSATAIMLAQRDSLDRSADSLVRVYLDSLETALPYDDVGQRILDAMPENGNCPEKCLNITFDWSLRNNSTSHVNIPLARWVCDEILFGRFSGLDFIRMVVTLLTALFCTMLMIDLFKEKK